MCLYKLKSSYINCIVANNNATMASKSENNQSFNKHLPIMNLNFSKMFNDLVIYSFFLHKNLIKQQKKI